VILKKILFKSIFFFTFSLVGLNSQAQLVETDTIKIIDKWDDEVHSPKSAAVYSAVLPGLGQAYNKKYWKIPLIYIGFGVIGYFIDWNNDHYQLNKVAYQHLTDSLPGTNDHLLLDAAVYYDLENSTDFANFKDGLTKRQDYYRRNRDLLFISAIGFYGLNIIDASVDAHLFNFDISDDLSFNWQPSILNFDNQIIYGFNCTFNF
jgi:hypothetical protein